MNQYKKILGGLNNMSISLSATDFLEYGDFLSKIGNPGLDNLFD
jgi:hypothetical protein